MTQFLPPNLLALFAARDPIPYLAPVDKLTHEKKRQAYTGIAEYLDQFEDPEETPPVVKPETKLQKLERKRREKAEQNAYKLEQDLALWNPANNPQSTSDPFKTLFVSRINYDTSESKLRREFEVFGKIKQIKLIHDTKTKKPRGYAFIEYEEESDMHAAYKKADGKKIDGRRVVVDIERGRTIKGWRPRRLGGGKGGRKSNDVNLNKRLSSPGRIDPGRIELRLNSRSPSSRDRERERDRDREREKERDKERDRDRVDKERKRSKEREKRSRSRSRDKDKKRRSKSKDRHRSKSKDRVKKARRSKSKERTSNKKRSRSREKTNRKDTAIKKDDISIKKEEMMDYSNNVNTQYGAY